MSKKHERIAATYQAKTPSQKNMVDAVGTIINGDISNVMIYGGVGTGKTQFAFYLKEMVSRFNNDPNRKTPFKSCTVITEFSINEEYLNKRRDIDKDQLFERTKREDILVVDEFCAFNQDSQSIKTSTELLMDFRYQEELVTIWITNADFSKIKRAYSEKFLDRMVESFTKIRAEGASLRRQK